MKNISIYLHQISELDKVLKANCEEVIVSSVLFSRFGQLSVNELNQVIEALSRSTKKVILDWDILMTEKVFSTKIAQLDKVNAKLIDGFRVQDVGAYHYVLKNYQDHENLNYERHKNHIISSFYFVHQL